MITLKTFSTASKQDIFNQVATHMLTQNQQCSIPRATLLENKCLYRLDNLKCAGGCLIADDEYNPLMEGQSIRSVVLSYLSKAGLNYPDEDSLNLLAALQSIHDKVHSDEWFVALRAAAIGRNLEMVARP